MSQSRNEFGGRNFAPKYLATRTGEVVDHVPGTGKAVQVLFEGARSPQDMVLSTPLHICVNESCCQPTVVRHSAINRIGNGMSEVSVNLRCINCDTRYSRVCSPGDVHALDDRMFEAQRVIEQTIASKPRSSSSAGPTRRCPPLRGFSSGPTCVCAPTAGAMRCKVP